jgi:hypothetical protein
MDNKLKDAEIHWHCAKVWTQTTRTQVIEKQLVLDKAVHAFEQAQAAEEAARLEFKRLGGEA